jgi:hypothetical protein
MISDEALKTALVGRMAKAFDRKSCKRLFVAGDIIELRVASFKKKLEIEFKCNLDSKKDLIASIVDQAMLRSTHRDGRFYFSGDTSIDSLSSHLKPDPNEMVCAFGEMPSPASHRARSATLTAPQMSAKFFKSSVARLVRAAICAREKVTARNIQQALEKKFDCCLRGKRLLILQAIVATLKAESIKQDKKAKS